jgi:hypothetical protein
MEIPLLLFFFAQPAGGGMALKHWLNSGTVGAGARAGID